MKLRRNKGNADRDQRQSTNSSGTGRRIFSYYANSAPRDIQQARTERRGKIVPRLRHWRYIPSFMALVAIILSILYILGLDTNPHISLADNQHTVAIHNVETYQKAAREALDSSIFNHNKLTIDTGTVVRHMKAQFPEIDQVAVTLPLLGHRPLVELTVVQPAVVLSSNNKLFAIAGNGKVVSSTAEATSPALKTLPLVIDKSNLKPEVGQAALLAVEVGFIAEANQQLKAQKITVQELSLPPIPNEIDIRLAGLPYFVKCNMTEDARLQIGTFLATKKKLESDNVTPHEYIDVRVEEKAFYK